MMAANNDKQIELPLMQAVRLTGEEKFVNADSQIPATVSHFWQWAMSDLVSNALRGVLAEFIVAWALGLHRGVRNEWDAYDLKTTRGRKIEVKSAAYVQSWYQRALSKITFSIRPTLAWDSATNCQAEEKRRQADIYVFCLLHHKDQSTINPLDLTQWTFYVICRDRLEQDRWEKKSMTLGKLKKLDPVVCTFLELRAGVEQVEQTLTSSRKI